MDAIRHITSEPVVMAVIVVMVGKCGVLCWAVCNQFKR